MRLQSPHIYPPFIYSAFSMAYAMDTLRAISARVHVDRQWAPLAVKRTSRNLEPVRLGPMHVRYTTIITNKKKDVLLQPAR